MVHARRAYRSAGSTWIDGVLWAILFSVCVIHVPHPDDVDDDDNDENDAEVNHRCSIPSRN